MIKIAIAGASGFVGKALLEKLQTNKNYQLNALSRQKKSSIESSNIQWIECDLFSLLDTEKSLQDCDIAFYLVHSMLPSAHLVQGNFADYDLILADNFARACQKNNIKKIIYLSGIIPEKLELSEHLKSRLEVEQTLSATQIPTITLRAGIILGSMGSSFSIMYNLVDRLPIMICPSWTKTLSNPVAIDDMVYALETCIDLPCHGPIHFDIGGATTLSYKNMMQELASILKKRRLFFSIPFFSPGLSKLWVSLITGAPKNLVYPLVSSLKTNMVVTHSKKSPFSNHHWKNYSQAILLSLAGRMNTSKPNAFSYTGSLQENEVRSIQRFENTHQLSAIRVANLYFNWLPSFFTPFIQVHNEDNQCFFHILGIKNPILHLEFSQSRSSEDRLLYYVKGGLLAKSKGRGRLEFRSVMNNQYIIIALHDFIPRLPWFIYKYTQAIVHLITMSFFKRYLKSLK